MSESSSCPKMFRRPWFSFAILTLLGERDFVKASVQRIKEINHLRIQEWEESIRKIDREEKELAEKKRQDELERRLGWGYSYPYLPPAYSMYVLGASGSGSSRNNGWFAAGGAGGAGGQGSIYNTVSTGRPVLYNGEIVQVS